MINKFNSLHSQTIYPAKSDNKKEWIRFYEKYMRYKRKSRLNRHSLSMVENSLTGVGSYPSLAPFYASNVSGNVNNGMMNNLNNKGNKTQQVFDGSVVSNYTMSGVSNNTTYYSNANNKANQQQQQSSTTMNIINSQ